MTNIAAQIKSEIHDEVEMASVDGYRQKNASTTVLTKMQSATKQLTSVQQIDKPLH